MLSSFMEQVNKIPVKDFSELKEWDLKVKADVIPTSPQEIAVLLEACFRRWSTVDDEFKSVAVPYIDSGIKTAKHFVSIEGGEEDFV